MSTSHAGPKRTVRSLIALLVAICSLLSAATGVLTSVLTYQRAVMPYNSEGNYFDGIVNYHDGAQFVYGAIALLAFATSGGMAWLAYRLVRPNNSFKPKPLRGSA